MPICTSFKVELATGLHNFTAGTGNAFRVALYTSAAALTAASTAYSATNEVSGTGYTATGLALTSVTPVASGTTAILDFADVSWTSASFTARYALIYNSTNANRSVAVIDFGADQTVTNGTFQIIWPTPDASNAIIRIS